MTRPAIFEMGADARFLSQTLRKSNVGDVLTYAELSVAIGKIVNGAFPALRTAIRAALRDEGAVFACIRKEGIKRLNDADIVSLGESETAGTRRRVKRTARKLTAVADYGAMKPRDQIRHTALLSINAMIADATKEKTIAKISTASGGRSIELPIRDTLKALGLL